MRAGSPLPNPTYSFGIMAYRGRQRYVPSLVDALGGAPVFWDPKRKRKRMESLWEVREGCLQLADRSADYHVMLQDDALLCADFIPKLEAVLAEGHEVICLYYRAKNKRKFHELNEAANAGYEAGGFTYPDLMWGVGMAIKTADIDALITYGGPVSEEHRHEWAGSEDRVIREFYRRKGVPTYYPLPSLVSHRPELNGRNGPNMGRQAKWFEA